MIELYEMTKLMDNNVVTLTSWQKEQLIIEVEIPQGRAATPATLLVSNRNSFYRHATKRSKTRHTLMDERSRRFYMHIIMGAATGFFYPYQTEYRS